MLKQWYYRVMNRRYSHPRGRSLYVYCGERLMQALARMFGQWVAARFAPDWMYEVWARLPESSGDWVGGETYGHYLHLEDAERVVRYLQASGFRSGWTQHRVILEVK